MAQTKMYRVRVLVDDGKPGLMPFTYILPASDRDAAISTTRKRIRLRKMVVKHVDFARQVNFSGS